MSWSATAISAVEGIRRALRQPGPTAEPVVGVEQLRVVADVVPASGEAIGVDGLALVEPGDEAARLVGVVPLLEVCLDERQIGAGVEIGGSGGERARRIGRLLDERDDAVVGVDLDDPVA